MKQTHQLVAALWAAFCTLGFSASLEAAPLRVCATVQDLGDLARAVGGDEVEVTVFAKGVEDPHFVEAKPGFIKALSQADVFVEMGMELETGWAPVLLQNARNARILPGADGFVDASTTIVPLEVPEGVIDRSHGDVHAAGNPHFLLDPGNGINVARLIAARLSSLRPDKAAYFDARLADFTDRLQKSLSQWEGELAPFKGTLYLGDHDMWVYFAKRFGLVNAGFLEPKPGVQPTTKHLQAIIEVVKERNVQLLFTSPYFDARHGRFVADHTNIKILPMAHQTGARPGAETYEQMIDYNVRTIVKALKP